jgi:polar amino acid transport system substrate-binding protein
VICRPIGYNLIGLKEMQRSVSFTIERPVSLRQCFGMLERGRVDLVFISDLVGWHTIAGIDGMDHTRFKALPFPGNKPKTGLHLLIARDHPTAQTILKRFNEGLSKLVATGEYERTIRDYIHDH